MINKFLSPRWWKLTPQERYLEVTLESYSGVEREIKKIELTVPEGPEKIKSLIDLKVQNGLLTEYEGQKELLKQTKTGLDLEKELLLLEVRSGRMEQEDFELAYLWKQYPGVLDNPKDKKYKEAKNKDLEIRHRYGSINYFDYRKALADTNDEPFIGVKSSEFEIETGRLLIEYDWNDKFIDLLKKSGYSGHDESDIVQSWMRIMNEYERMEDEGIEITNVGDLIRPNID